MSDYLTRDLSAPASPGTLRSRTSHWSATRWAILIIAAVELAVIVWAITLYIRHAPTRSPHAIQHISTGGK
jgi:hypothetical protein